MSNHMIIISSVLILLFVVTLYWFRINGGIAFPTAANLFIFFQILPIIGTIIHIQYSAQHPRRLFIMLLGLSALIFGCFLASKFSQFNPKKEYKEYRRMPIINDIHGSLFIWGVVFLGLLSLILGFIFVWRAGYNVPIALIKSYLLTGDISETWVTYGNLRTFVGRHPENYIAAGYAAQFMKILIPLIFFMFYFRSIDNNSNIEKFNAFCWLFISTFFLTTTGVRGNIIIFALSFVILSSKKFGPISQYIGKRVFILPAISVLLAIMFFSFFSVLGGRTSVPGILIGVSDSKESVVESQIATKSLVGGPDTKESVVESPNYFTSLASILIGSSSAFINRVIFIQADIQAKIMNYIASLEPGLGKGWIDSLSIILPGTQTTQSRQTYEVVYGGFGNAPVDLWNSIWMEYRLPGIIFVPIVIGFLLQKFSIMTLRGERTLSRAIIFLLAAIALMDLNEPISIFNNGFVTLMIYYVMTKAIKTYEMNKLITDIR